MAQNIHTLFISNVGPASRLFLNEDPLRPLSQW